MIRTLVAVLLAVWLAAPVWAGDNEDDAHSGKVDVFGDGDSGQGNDPAVEDAVNEILDDDVLDGAAGDDKERAELAGKLRKECDRDGDGKLTGEERVKAKKLLAEKRHRSLKEQFAKEYDKDHDGKLSDEEEAKMKAVLEQRVKRCHEHHQRFAKHFDADGDGELNGDERKAMRTAWGEHKKKMVHKVKEHEKEKGKEHGKDKVKEHGKDKVKEHGKDKGKGK